MSYQSSERLSASQNSGEQPTLKGCYRVEAKVGEGGMATVYRATHLDLQLPVAIKLLHPDIAQNPQLRERFLQEARIQFKLKHPHIVQVTDFINESGTVGYVLEWVDGIDLKTWLSHRKGLLLESELGQIMQPILQGVSYAHEQGVIHRDLKPANVLLHIANQSLVPKIADFGIAKVMAQSQHQPVTRDQDSLGTLHYMAPEQINDTKTADHRADIYSLGVILFELATGQLPFSGTPPHLIYAHIWSPPPSPRVLQPALSVALESVILRCLEKNPEARFQSVSALLTAFQQAFAAPSAPLLQEFGNAPFLPVKQRRGLWLVGTMFLLITLGTGGLWAWQIWLPPSSETPDSGKPSEGNTPSKPQPSGNLLTTPAVVKKRPDPSLNRQTPSADFTKPQTPRSPQAEPTPSKVLDSSDTKPGYSRLHVTARHTPLPSVNPRESMPRVMARRAPTLSVNPREERDPLLNRQKPSARRKPQPRRVQKKSQMVLTRRQSGKQHTLQHQRVRRAMEKSCQFPDKQKRSRYVYQKLGDKTVASAPALIQGFQHKSPCVRDVAAALLIFLGGRHSSVRQHLQHATNDQNPWIQRRAKSVLSFLAKRYGLSGEGTAKVETFNHDLEPKTKQPSRRSVISGRTSSKELQRHVQSLQDPDLRVRLAAVAKLKLLGDSARPVIPQLLQFVLHQQEPLWKRCQAISALAPMYSHDKRILPALVFLYVHSRGSGCFFKSIVNGVGSAMVPPLLEELEQQKKPSSQVSIMQLLAEIGKQSPQTVSIFIKKLQDPHRWIRSEAARLLGYMGTIATRAIPALLQAAQNEDDSRTIIAFRCTVAQSLGSLCSHSRQAVAALVVLLRDPNETVRIETARALGMAAKCAMSAIPALEEATRDSSRSVQTYARRALQKLGTMRLPQNGN